MISIIFPCFNEIENLKKNLEILKKFLLNNKHLEIIFVDNGSSDGTTKYLNTKLKDFQNVKIIKIKLNKGYGDGIFNGIKIAKYHVVGWMHADFQVSLSELKKGCEIYIKNQKKFNGNLFVKSIRKNRNFADIIFTFFMSLVVSILFGKKIHDINSTPNIINKNIFEHIRNIPKDFSFDLFCYILATKRKYKILRYNIEYKERLYGHSKWNFSFKSKIYLSLRILKYIIKIRVLGFK